MMTSLPMIPEPLEIAEIWLPDRGYYVKTKTGGIEWREAPPLLLIKCPAWGCEWQTNAESYPWLWLEHLRSHRYEPFTMAKP
jgi:hypothetical protein